MWKEHYLYEQMEILITIQLFFKLTACDAELMPSFPQHRLRRKIQKEEEKQKSEEDKKRRTSEGSFQDFGGSLSVSTSSVA